MSVFDYSGATDENDRRRKAQSHMMNAAYAMVPSIRGADWQTCQWAILAELGHIRFTATPEDAADAGGILWVKPTTLEGGESGVAHLLDPVEPA